ncbi:MAG: M48 family metalloprotease [Rhodospirillaceae bacterium]
MFRRILLVAVLLTAATLIAPGPASAQRKSLIEDTEIENTLRAFSTPLFKIAGLKASNVKIYIVNDATLNAFVTGGQKLFVNSGLIEQSESANELIGVIAHETGHIAGGHLSRVHDALFNASTSSILAFLLGGAATIATGRGDVGAAIAAGGQGVAARNFLAYSRTQEGAADHAALGFLDKTGQSARGLLNFMERLEDQELLSFAQQDPYVRSHPLARDRIEAVAAHVEKSAVSDAPEPPEFREIYDRMKAKLFAFLHPYATTIARYAETDNSLRTRYARAIAEYRHSQLDRALALIDGLIAERPHDPYFHELKGQMLFENGRVVAAIDAYATAAEILPDAPAIRRDLARAQLESHDAAVLDAAISNLEIAKINNQDSASIWRFLAIAHGRKGDMPRSYLALGEEALLQGRPDVARFQAERAKESFPRGSREWLQAEDILVATGDLERALKREKDRQ